MDMKTLKMYESPKMEVVKLKSQGPLLAESGDEIPGDARPANWEED